ncbi:hypothetical protein TNCV_1057821 [Trichonephila clavipes]|nr:hypothetical protein TNCV_1057821 [Trichonephila clavipes]
MATPGSSFTPIPLGHEDNLESSVISDLGVEGLGVIDKAANTTSYTFRLLRRQSSQPGPRWSRRGLRKQNSSYGPRGRSLGRRGQASVPANLPDHPAQSIALVILYPKHFAHLR